MILARRILFFIFLGLYLILCPLLILYAFGYIFNPVKQELSRTGLIYLSSIPQGADIYFGKSRYRQKTPASISELVPGNYEITLRKKGYKPWSAKAGVKLGKASVFKDVLLIPRAWLAKNLLRDNFVKLTPLRGTGYFLVASGNNLGSFSAYECKTGQLIPLVSAVSGLSGAPGSEEARPQYWLDLPVVSIFTEEDSHIFIAYAGSLWNRKYLYINIAKTPPEVVDISRLIQEKPSGIAWLDSNRSKIFTFHKDYLNLLDVRSMSVSPRYLENIKGYGLYDKWIYSLEEENNIFRQAYDKAQRELLFSNAQFGEGFFKQAESYKIKVLDSDIVVFLSQKGELIMNLAPYSLAGRQVTGLEFFKDNLKLLYWGRQEIGVVDFSKKEGEEPLFEEGVLRDNILYTGKNITDCFLANEGTYVIFNDNNKLCLLRIEPRAWPRVEIITQIKDNSSFFYSEKTGCAYYLEPISGNLNSIEVISKKKPADGI